MATIIDSLVVELGLDTTKFTAAQQQMVQQLRGAGNAAQRATEDLGTQMMGFFRFLRDPIRGFHLQLEALSKPLSGVAANANAAAQQMHRTGVAGATAGTTAAAGVRALAIAGLGAIAVFEGLKKTLEAVNSSAKESFAAGVGAAAAGMSVQGFSATAQALFQHGNVPQEQTESWLVREQQMIQDLRRGVPPDPAVMTAMALAHVTPFAPPEQQLQQFARWAATASPAQAINVGGALGMSPEMVLALQKAGTNLSNLVNQAQRTAVQPRDVENANKLLNAENQLEVTYGKLWRTIVTDLEPTLISFLDDLTGLGKNLETISEDAAPVISFFGGVAKFMTDLANPPSAIDALLGNGKWTAWAGKLLKDFQGGGAGAAAGSATSGSLSSIFGTIESGNPNPSTPWDYQQLPSFVKQYGYGSAGFWNWANQAMTTNPNLTLGDAYAQYNQGTGTPGSGITWAQLASKNPMAYRNATNVFARYGVSPSTPVSSLTNTGSNLASGGKAPPGGYFGDAGSWGALPTLRGAQSGVVGMSGGGVGSGSTVSNDNSTANNVVMNGDVNVQTNATDGRGVVNAFNDAINRNLFVNQAVQGLV